jgi:hypothetical protein
MMRLTDLRISPFEVKLIGVNEPLAQAIIEFLSQQHAAVNTRARGLNLGRVFIESAYIYHLSKQAMAT